MVVLPLIYNLSSLITDDNYLSENHYYLGLIGCLKCRNFVIEINNYQTRYNQLK